MCKRRSFRCCVLLFSNLLLLLQACSPARPRYIFSTPTAPPLATPTPVNSRPAYQPGTLVDYIAQSGDTLQNLSIRFGCQVQEILKANPQIPADVSTLPPGFPMKMPIYYEAFWGSEFQIIPDAAFVYGPDLVDFDLQAFLQSTPGWFKSYPAYLDSEHNSLVEVLSYYARNYSLNPKMLLALVEYQTGALSSAKRSPLADGAFLGFNNNHKGVILQISYVSNLLNDYFYRYQQGTLQAIEHPDGHIENIDPWQNGASVALQNLFAQLYSAEEYQKAISVEGYAKTYKLLFGDPFQRDMTVLPGSLRQPDFILPFSSGSTWSLTGGPHTAWGSLQPWAAVDFSPPMTTYGCAPSDSYALAMADGVVVRLEPGLVMLDLDGDGDERTGWVLLYLHVATQDRVSLGQVLKQGDPVGHPSCEGGRSTGTHIHIARKYNGQWIVASSAALPFDIAGWQAVDGDVPYAGGLIRGTRFVRASTASGSDSLITAE